MESDRWVPYNESRLSPEACGNGTTLGDALERSDKIVGDAEQIRM